jgi:cell division protein FtsQ
VLFLLLFLTSPLGTIQSIQISGNRLLTQEEILRRINDYRGVSYFQVSRTDLETSLKSFSEVDRVQVEKKFPNKLYIMIQEKSVVAMMKMEDQRLLPLLSDGSVSNRRSSISHPFKGPIFEGWKNFEPIAKKVAVRLMGLPKPILNEIEVIKPVKNHKDQVQIWSKRKHQIFLRLDDIDKMMKIYPSFVHHPRGKLYLLKSIWFEADQIDKTEKKDRSKTIQKS